MSAVVWIVEGGSWVRAQRLPGPVVPGGTHGTEAEARAALAADLRARARLLAASADHHEKMGSLSAVRMAAAPDLVDRFEDRMVPSIDAALQKVGLGRLTAEDVESASVESRPTSVRATFPGRGWFLFGVDIDYDLDGGSLRDCTTYPLSCGTWDGVDLVSAWSAAEKRMEVVRAG